jgi:eukaryotic-like serine/threonine-protein kinase
MAEVVDNQLVDGRYRVTGRIGSGGMADVFCAEDTVLGREVALKVLHRRFAQDAEFVERFRREAKSAAGLQHPNVVAVFDRGEHDGTYYIAMERLRGRTLKQLIGAEAPLDEVRAIDLATQILRAAGFAHRRGVIHRDFKPQNIVVDAGDEVKVTDFGIARAGASEITETGSIMGTAQYLSPEQAQGQAVSPASDLYAISVVLYEMLCGRVPFEGDSAVSIALRHLNDAPEPPSRMRPGLHPALEQIVMHGLAKDPARRFASADDMIAALAEVRERIVAGDRGAGDTMAYAAFALEGDAEERLPRRRRWAAIAALALLALVLGGLAAWALLAQPDEVAVPDVVGQPLLQAEAALAREGFDVEVRRVRDVKPEDEVIRQDPAGGARIEEGSPVTLHVSAGPGEARVPSVDGLSQRQAVRELNDAGFVVTVDEEPHDEIRRGFAIRTVPEGGQVLGRGERVRLLVSSGPELVRVPDVTGSTESSAESTLRSRGLLVRVVEREAETREGIVLDQDPDGGARVREGTSVTIHVSKQPETAAVPSVGGQTAAEARATLRGAGFGIEVRRQPTEDEDEDGVVVDQSPDAGTQLRPGRTVVVYVGRYEEPTPKEPPPDDVEPPAEQP